MRLIEQFAAFGLANACAKVAGKPLVFLYCTYLLENEIEGT